MSLSTNFQMQKILTGITEKMETHLAGKNPAQWATQYRVLPSGPWKFTGRKYLKAIHNCKAPRIVAPKGAQMGFTETMLNRCFYGIDIEGEDSLYVLPTRDDRSDFSAGRFDSALDLSPHLKNLFTDVNNVGHKKAGHVNMYCRGSNSRSGLKGIPAGRLYLDERDEIAENMISLARERLSGHQNPLEMDISTPTVAEAGIWRDWEVSRQMRWFVSCLFCGKKQTLDWPKSIQWEGTVHRVRADLICEYCKKVFPQERKAELVDTGTWEVVKNREADHVGFHISQLYSITMIPQEIVRLFLTEGEEYQAEFFNSKLGKPYTPKGSQITRDLVLKAVNRDGVSFNQWNFADSSCMGIDVAADGNHWIEIADIDEKDRKIVLVARRATWEELPTLMKQYNVRCCVIDAQPERSLARRFVSEYSGIAYVAFYPEGLKTAFKVDEEKQIVSIERSEALDKVQNRFRLNTVYLPKDMYYLQTYVDHLCAPVKTFRATRTGLPKVRYISVGGDHFAHASVYCEIALAMSPVSRLEIQHHFPDKEKIRRPGSIFL